MIRNTTHQFLLFLLTVTFSCPFLLPQQVDFEDPAFSPGDSVAGAGVIHPWLDIFSPNGPVLSGSPDDADPELAVAYRSPVVKVVEGGDSNVGYWPNGCMGAPGLYFEQGDTALLATGHGIRDPNPGPDLWYGFAFGGRSAAHFSVDLLDYGDFFPNDLDASMTHTVQLIAYDQNGIALDLDTLTFSSNGSGQIGRTLVWQGSSYDSALLGDACTASAGQPGYRTFTVTSPGMHQVELVFVGGASVDPGHALDNIHFALDVRIDFKPGSSRNPSNPKSNGTVPVAILGADNFDVSEIDAASLLLGVMEVKTRKNGTLQCAYEDVSGDYSANPEGAPDGWTDLLCHFEGDEVEAFSPGNVLELTGMLLDGTPFLGTTSVQTVPPAK